MRRPSDAQKSVTSTVTEAAFARRRLAGARRLSDARQAAAVSRGLEGLLTGDATLGGRLSVKSPAGRGTVVAGEIPFTPDQG